jgi:hypothetical protein
VDRSGGESLVIGQEEALLERGDRPATSRRLSGAGRPAVPASEVNDVEFIVTVAGKDGTVLDWFDVEYEGAVEGADQANARAAVLEAAGLISDGVF